METSLHRELKALYSPDASRREVALDGFRIDAIDDGRLIEIQYGSLAALRDKIRRLLAAHEVHVVKPLAARKYLVTRKRKRGPIVSARWSPSRETIYDLFLDLVHFTGVFPHARLTLEVVLTEQEEHRLPARKRRWNGKNYRVEDRCLRSIAGRVVLRTAADLAALIPAAVPGEFTTAELAEAAGIPRWLAQKMAYCLRKTGAVDVAGKRRHAILYRRRLAARRAA